jgi:hypothetical protein
MALYKIYSVNFSEIGDKHSLISASKDNILESICHRAREKGTAHFYDESAQFCDVHLIEFHHQMA